VVCFRQTTSLFVQPFIFGSRGENFELEMEQVPFYCQKEILIVGVGNVLFGDDGFGPEVIDYLKSHYDIPGNVCLADAGTGIRKILFTISLSDVRPKVIVIIDAVDKGKRPGEIFDIPLDEIPFEKIDDFSMHQVPSSNLLKELQDFCHVKVVIKVCQIKEIPETIQSGLSDPLKNAVPILAEKIAEEYFLT
jgi:coenzyme F420 hydrogenase subunit delta